MAEIRILEFATYAGMGGTQRILLEFLRHASRETYRFALCVLLEHGLLNEEASQLGIENISLNMRGYGDLSAWWKFYRYAKDRRFDLIRTYGLKADIIGRLVGAALGIPVNITSVRSTDPWRKWYHVGLDSWTSGLTALYLSNSEAGRLAIHRRERIPLDKIVTIHNGLDLTPYRSASANAPAIQAQYRQVFGIAPTTRVLGIVANLGAMKGHTTLVDALPQILAQFPDVKCLFVGRDDVNGAIHRYVREKHLEQTVILTGLRSDIPELLTLFDIFLLPSLWEGFPTALLEAMAMKKPVVSTAVGGTPELIDSENTGVLIPPRDPEALADAVIGLLSHPDRARMMGEAAQARVQQDFSIQTMVTETEALYARLLLTARTRHIAN